MIRTQIRRNSALIDGYVRAVELLVNKEKCPVDTNTLLELRKRLSISIEENDTFRRVLWRQIELREVVSLSDDLDLSAVSFLVGQIKSRERLLAAQAAMK